MGTYSETTDMRPEANTSPSLPHFSWFYPQSFYPAQNFSPFHSQETQNNMLPGIPVVPLRSIPPTPEPTMYNSTTKTAKAKKPELSAKVSNPISPSTEQPKKTPSRKRGKRNFDVDADKLMNLDLSKTPSPVCSCTGIERVCYKWGTGGWQSSCCTKSLSLHPLPMSPVKPGARVTGRKMSTGAYLKLLLKLSAEGYDLSRPVDLKHHWAKHGTNKFITIK